MVCKTKLSTNTYYCTIFSLTIESLSFFLSQSSEIFFLFERYRSETIILLILEDLKNSFNVLILGSMIFIDIERSYVKYRLFLSIRFRLLIQYIIRLYVYAPNIYNSHQTIFYMLGVKPVLVKHTI